MLKTLPAKNIGETTKNYHKLTCCTDTVINETDFEYGFD